MDPAAWKEWITVPKLRNLLVRPEAGQTQERRQA